MKKLCNLKNKKLKEIEKIVNIVCEIVSEENQKKFDKTLYENNIITYRDSICYSLSIAYARNDINIKLKKEYKKNDNLLKERMLYLFNLGFESKLKIEAIDRALFDIKKRNKKRFYEFFKN